MDATFRYTAYGLDIDSDLELPELDSRSFTGDVRLRRGTVATPVLPLRNDRSAFRQRELFIWSGLLAVLVREGREIVFDPSDDVDPAWMRQCLLGPPLGILLHQRGLLVLHASAVEVDDQAVIFAGDKGEGKSTIAAALVAAGHRLIADDIVAIDMLDPACPIVLPGVPQLRLWPDAADMVGAPPDALLQFHPKLEKRAWRLECRHQRRTQPLRRIYVLGRESELGLELLPSRKESFSAILQHLYAPRFLDARCITQALLSKCVKLAEAVQVYRLDRPNTLETLRDVADLIEEHAERTTILSPAVPELQNASI